MLSVLRLSGVRQDAARELDPADELRALSDADFGADLDARLARERARLARAREALANRLVAIYETGVADPASLILGSGDYEELATRADYLRLISEADSALAARVEQVRDQVRRTAARVEALHGRAVAYDERLAAAREEISSVRAAAEAAPEAGGEITLTTAYRHGLRLAVPGGEARRHLPLMVEVADNGSGIPDHLKPHLFDPFVTTKRNGTGLGLAIVAKVIGVPVANVRPCPGCF